MVYSKLKDQVKLPAVIVTQRDMEATFEAYVDALVKIIGKHRTCVKEAERRG